MTTVFQEAGFKAAGIDTRFFGETHTDTAPHVISSFIELESEDGAKERTRLACSGREEAMPGELCRAVERLRRG